MKLKSDMIIPNLYQWMEAVRKISAILTEQ